MRVIVVGNGVAGSTAARRIRELDPECEIAIYAREPYHYYYRPRLPEVVAGEVEVEDIITTQPDWYKEHRIDVHLSSPIRTVDIEKKSVALEDGTTADYDRLLIASGSDPFVPPVEGVEKPGVFTLRSAADALAIREWAGGVDAAVVVGGGLLGLETARGLKAAGLTVNVLEHADRLLPRQLDEGGARILRSEIEKLGLNVVTGAGTTEVSGEGKATGVMLKDGRAVEGGLVLFSTGVRPTVGLLATSGAEIDRGVVVDCDMRTTVPDVLAAGDCAQFEGTVWGIIPVAVAQAEAAARTIAGGNDQPYCAVVPSNTLKITGVDVFSAGTVSCEGGACREFVEEDAKRGLYRKTVVEDGRLVGAIAVGSKAGVKELGALIERGTPVEKWGEAIVREGFDYAAALKEEAPQA